jgi:hypothetical protein
VATLFCVRRNARRRLLLLKCGVLSAECAYKTKDVKGYDNRRCQTCTLFRSFRCCKCAGECDMIFPPWFESQSIMRKPPATTME